jgi:16S rRNA C1402 (ribose-2'-O) methylase RsmI
MKTSVDELNILIKALRCLRQFKMSIKEDVREVNDLLKKLQPIQMRVLEHNQKMENQATKKKEIESQVNPQTGGLVKDEATN